MKRTILSVVVFALLSAIIGAEPAAAHAAGATVLGALGRDQLVTIVTPPEATAVEQFAGVELSKYLELSLGVRATLTTAPPVGPAGVVFFLGTFDEVNAKWRNMLPPEIKSAAVGADKLVEDGVLIHANNGKVLLTGKGRRGALNAVYTFLEDVVGCKWPEPDREFVPRLDSLPLERLEIASNPAFKYRGLGIHGRCSRVCFKNLIDWMSKNRLNVFEMHAGKIDHMHCIDYYEEYRVDVLNDILKRGLSPIIGGHSLEFFFLSKECCKTHPEYWALVDGKRNGSQICYSNLDSVNPYAANVVEYLKSRPEIKAVDLYPSDGFLTCQCERCKNAYVTDLRIRYMNALMGKINESLPGVKGNYLAYIYYVEPPKQIKPVPNLVPNYCEYTTRSQLRPITDNVDLNAMHRRNLEAWIKASNEVIVFSYYGDDCIKAFLYHPMMDVILEDLRYYHKIGLAGNFVLATDPELWWSNAPHLYAYAKAAWNPGVELATVESDYYRSVYGPTADAMRGHAKACRDSRAADIKDCLAKARRLAQDAWTWNRIRMLDIDADFVQFYRELPDLTKDWAKMTPAARAALIERAEKILANDVLREDRRGFQSASNRLKIRFSELGAPLIVAENEEELRKLKRQDESRKK